MRAIERTVHSLIANSFNPTCGAEVVRPRVNAVNSCQARSHSRHNNVGGVSD